ncbi:nitroreductase family protein [Prauserella alba]|uniref:Nitroreductase domain-containing protein n=1 Tax=Prauserella alba TaxID=176898 RepID=A0ABN1VC48_9PSEU|nr:nitroreductase family protein [Prauserella alba]MCP2178989.1 Nitroreductase [Prauserella alba]
MSDAPDSVDSLRALVGRPSRRLFSADPVPREDVERMVDVARRTGSARNRQPWRFVAVADAGVRRQLAGCGAYAGHLAGAPLVLVLLTRDNGFRDTPFDLGRVTQSLTVAAAALGYDTCLATFYPDDNVRAADRLLGVDGPWHAEHAMSVGRAGSDADSVSGNSVSGNSAVPTGRHPVSELLTWHG